MFVERSQRFEGFARRTRRVSGHRLDRGQVRASGEALLVDRGGHAKDPEQSEAAIRQRVGKRLDERR